MIQPNCSCGKHHTFIMCRECDEPFKTMKEVQDHEKATRHHFFKRMGNKT
jgi:hypothetical protein